jgi:hypothetical protein
MGRRSQPRKPVEVPVRIFGTDSHGQVFSEKVTTVNVSRNGAELAGVRPALALDEIIGLTYGSNRVHFRVKWIGEPGTARAGHVGLLNIAPEKPLWDFELPAAIKDDYEAASVEHRKNVRYRCQNSIEIHTPEGASFWGRVADLSQTGCYVEIPIPFELGKKLKIGIWFGQTKAWAEARVAHQTPGVGVGLMFTEISEADLGQIRGYLETLSPFARIPSRTSTSAQRKL